MGFIKALPVWADGLEKEKNITLGLYTDFCFSGEKTVLRVTGSSLYRAFLNGELVAYGPARAPHHHFRIDEWDLTAFCREGSNSLYIETAGYNINTFYTLDQPAFAQAELMLGDSVAAATGVHNFTGRVVTERVQKTPKYSFQRPFTEAWKLDAAYAASFFNRPEDPAVLTVQPAVKYLPRYVQYPEFKRVLPSKIASSGIATDGHKREKYRRDRAVANISPVLKGYPIDELEVNLNDLAQEFDFTPDAAPAAMNEKIRLEPNRYVVYGYDVIDAGFPSFRVECEKDMTLWLIWDEILKDGDVEFNRHIECVNAMRLDLKAGNYYFTGFEAYVYMGMKFIALGGGCTISDVQLIEYAAPLPKLRPCPVDDPEIKMIYDAAVNCFRLCCLESFMDDPSRERNDCLFDSYFMGAAEKMLTGESNVEHNMMEAYRLFKDEDILPLCDGQLPTMYPGDHYDHFYAPTHQMWLVLQLREYVRRTGDNDMAEGLKERFYKSYRYFEGFMNKEGLLEHLVGWVFLDWGEANNTARGAAVSFSANMIYAGMLDAMAELYDDEKLAEEAARIRKTVREISFKGGFFHEIAGRDENGELKITETVTQSCQTYAFFFGVADPEKDRDLLQKLVTGADGMSNQHSLTQPIRLGIIFKYLDKETFFSELKRVYLYQAKQTGSFWEDDDPQRNLIEAIHSEIAVMIDSLRD